MKLRAASLIQYDDPETGEEVIFEPGDSCDGIDEARLGPPWNYLELGIIERVGGGSATDKDLPPDTDSAADAAPPDDELAEILAQNVGDVASEIAEGDHDNYLEALGKAEKAGEDRKGIHRAIARRRDELAEARNQGG